jgi:hypothetical protein
MFKKTNKTMDVLMNALEPGAEKPDMKIIAAEQREQEEQLKRFKKKWKA